MGNGAHLLPGELASHAHNAVTNNTGNHSHTITMQHDESITTNYATPGGDGNDRTATTSINGTHTHTITVNSTGSNLAHNNLSPYITAYIWRRNK